MKTGILAIPAMLLLIGGFVLFYKIEWQISFDFAAHINMWWFTFQTVLSLAMFVSGFLLMLFVFGLL